MGARSTHTDEATTSDVGSEKLGAVNTGGLGSTSGRGWQRDLAAFVGIGAVCLGMLATVLAFVFSELSADDKARLRVPTSLEAAQAVGATLAAYTEQHFVRVLCGHGLTYLFLQTFAIPGTVFVNLLGGALFGLWVGFPLCLVYNTLGSVFLYLLSQHLGRRLVARFFAARLAAFRQTLQEETTGSSLTVYMTFMRIFPFTPNWFMNISAPQLGIPVPQFAAAVFMGLTPYNFLSCSAGLALSRLRSRNDVIDPWTTAQLAAIAVVGIAAPTASRYFGLAPGASRRGKRD